jgi:acyl phosphate:glycerol-3-phosphate acyltransferase
MLVRLLWLFAAYGLGSIPFGVVVARGVKGVDPREAGSRNPGATNVARLCGLPCGAATLALDIAKGLVPVLVAGQFSDDWRYLSLVAVAAVFGHMFSVFLKFKGGKAVATTIGVFLGLAPTAIALSAGLCVAAIAASGFVSVGSLLLAASLPFTVLVTGKSQFFLAALVIGSCIVWRHRENIARLRRGEEKSWRKKEKA